MPSWLRTSIIAGVSAVWLASYAAASIPAFDYEPPPGLNYTFLFVVGGAIAIGRRGKDDDDDK